MKIRVNNMHIENDVVNNEPKLILTDENGEEWVMSSRTICYEGAGVPFLCKKDSDWYFDKKNKTK